MRSGRRRPTRTGLPWLGEVAAFEGLDEAVHLAERRDAGDRLLAVGPGVGDGAEQLAVDGRSGLPLMPAMTPVFSRSSPDSRQSTISRPGLVFLRTPSTSASKVSTLVPFMTVRPTPFMPARTSSTCQ